MAPTAAPTHDASPAVYAEQLRSNPGSMAQVLAKLHQAHGNSFVQLVLAELKQASSSSSGTPLPRETRARMEQAFGTDLSAIRVHQDGAAEAAGAEAFASGTDIHFAAGRFDPQSPKGQELIGHEVAHVVQQSQGRASSVQHKGASSMSEDPGLESEADQAGARAARGEQAGIGGVETLSAPTPVVQRKASVVPVAAGLKTKLDVLGDGTATHPGLPIAELEAYVMKQADWFTEPSFSPADRDAVWKVIHLLSFGPHISRALAKLHTGEVAALPTRSILNTYASAFDPSADQIQLSTPAPTLARALQLGQALRELATFVPGPVLRHVIPESGLDYLMTAGKIPDLRTYYQKFRPSIEKAEEWPYVVDVLQEGIGMWASLAGWVSELHIFTPTTRALLMVNVAKCGECLDDIRDLQGRRVRESKARGRGRPRYRWNQARVPANRYRARGRAASRGGVLCGPIYRHRGDDGGDADTHAHTPPERSLANLHSRRIRARTPWRGRVDRRCVGSRRYRAARWRLE